MTTGPRNERHLTVGLPSGDADSWGEVPTIFKGPYIDTPFGAATRVQYEPDVSGRVQLAEVYTSEAHFDWSEYHITRDANRRVILHEVNEEGETTNRLIIRGNELIDLGASLEAETIVSYQPKEGEDFVAVTMGAPYALSRTVTTDGNGLLTKRPIRKVEISTDKVRQGQQNSAHYEQRGLDPFDATEELIKLLKSDPNELSVDSRLAAAPPPDAANVTHPAPNPVERTQPAPDPAQRVYLPPNSAEVVDMAPPLKYAPPPDAAERIELALNSVDEANTERSPENLEYEKQMWELVPREYKQELERVLAKVDDELRGVRIYHYLLENNLIEPDRQKGSLREKAAQAYRKVGVKVMDMTVHRPAAYFTDHERGKKRRGRLFAAAGVLTVGYLGLKGVSAAGLFEDDSIRSVGVYEGDEGGRRRMPSATELSETSPEPPDDPRPGTSKPIEISVDDVGDKPVSAIYEQVEGERKGFLDMHQAAQTAMANGELTKVQPDPSNPNLFWYEVTKKGANGFDPDATGSSRTVDVLRVLSSYDKANIKVAT